MSEMVVVASVARLMTKALFVPLHVTHTLAPSGLTAMSEQSEPTATVPRSAYVAASNTFTLLLASFTTHTCEPSGVKARSQGVAPAPAENVLRMAGDVS